LQDQAFPSCCFQKTTGGKEENVEEEGDQHFTTQLIVQRVCSLCKIQCIISPENNASSWIASKSLLELLDSYMQVRMMMMMMIMESEMHQHYNNLFYYYTIGDFYMTFIIYLLFWRCLQALGKLPKLRLEVCRDQFLLRQ